MKSNIPSNLKRSSYYLFGRIASFTQGNKFVIRILQLLILLNSIASSLCLLYSVKDIRYLLTWNNLVAETKDTYLWSLAIFDVQRNA